MKPLQELEKNGSVTDGRTDGRKDMSGSKIPHWNKFQWGIINVHFLLLKDAQGLLRHLRIYSRQKVTSKTMSCTLVDILHYMKQRSHVIHHDGLRHR